MTKEQWATIQYFRPNEFDSPDAPGSGEAMDYGFIFKLDFIRSQCPFPFYINSGIRTAAHNKEVGGVDSSAHVRGFAADIKVADSLQRYTLIQYALNAGIQRIGIGSAFVHLDLDPTLPAPRIWTY